MRPFLLGAALGAVAALAWAAGFVLLDRGVVAEGRAV